jgi:phage tail protein X
MPGENSSSELAAFTVPPQCDGCSMAERYVTRLEGMRDAAVAAIRGFEQSGRMLKPGVTALNRNLPDMPENPDARSPYTTELNARKAAVPIATQAANEHLDWLAQNCEGASSTQSQTRRGLGLFTTSKTAKVCGMGDAWWRDESNHPRVFFMPASAKPHLE